MFRSTSRRPRVQGVQQTVVGVAGVAEPDARPPLAAHVPLFAVGAVVSSSETIPTPTLWQPEMDATVAAVPLQLVPLKTWT
jgi:hypothetical protein